MKKYLSIALCIALLLSLTACAKDGQNGNASGVSSFVQEHTASFVEPVQETVKCTIEGNVLTYRDTDATKTQTVKYTYNTSGKLIAKSYYAECSTKQEAQSIYDSTVGQNRFAAEIMYENLKINGKTVSFDYTDFAMQFDKELTMEEMKSQLENAYIKMK
ncbi:MAG: hypothetical protein KBS41_00490 [Oscillospiraceae bacterium]|nr:hypothetical protein [Candidatus Equicaccousia limihippi]